MQEQKLQYYGGILGALIPLSFFVLSIVCLTFSGIFATEAFFGPMFVSIGLAVLLCKDRQGACKALIEGITDRIVGTMVLSFVGAGVLSKLLLASGVMHTVASLFYEMKIDSRGLFTVMTFFLCCLLAFSCGTSTGTCMVATPVLYPIGVALGVYPMLLLGAIYSGARFGDNLSPVSDTTIAAAGTQGVEIKDLMPFRFRYALKAAGVSALGYLIANIFLNGSAIQKSMGIAPLARFDSADSASLFMLIAPLLSVWLCIKGKQMIVALWSSVFCAAAIGLLSGCLNPEDIFYARAPRICGGALINGVTSASTIILLNAFIVCLVGALRKAGIDEYAERYVEKVVHGKRSAELASFLLVTIFYPLVACNAPTILLCGPFVKTLGEKYGVSPIRRANLIDMAANGITGNLPHINTMLSLIAAVESANQGMRYVPHISAVHIGMLAFHPAMLTIIALCSIARGNSKE